MEGGTKSRRRSLVVLAAAAAHLACVVLGALHVDLRDLGRGERGPVLRTLAYYSTITGADSAYGFFAPDVGALPWAVFEVTDASGAVTSDVLESGTKGEADLRVRNIVGMFWNEGTESLRRSLVASWAGKVFARHPGAVSVVVQLRSYDLPSMQEIRERTPPGWVVHYQAKFVPQAKLRAAQGAP